MAVLGRSTLKRYFETGDGLANRPFVDTADSVANLSNTTAQNFAAGISMPSLVVGGVSAGALDTQVLTATSALFGRFRQGAAGRQGHPVLMQEATAPGGVSTIIGFLPFPSSIVSLSVRVLAASSAQAGGTTTQFLAQGGAFEYAGFQNVSGIGEYAITSAASARNLQNVSGAVILSMDSASAGAVFLGQVQYYTTTTTAGAPTISITFIIIADSAGNDSSYSFASTSIGGAATNRRVVVGVFGASVSGAIGATSVTIGGVSATKIKAQQSGDAALTAELWAATVPMGTTATIVVAFDTTGTCCSIAVWTIYGSGLAAANSAASNVNPGIATLIVPAGGGIIGFAVSNTDSTSTWTGLTEDTDDEVEGRDYTGASRQFGTSQSVDMTVAYGGGPTQQAAVFASWGPE